MNRAEMDAAVEARIAERRAEDRSLGPEMTAERWRVIGGDDVMWSHEPSGRCVTVEGQWQRNSKTSNCLSVPALHGEPADPETSGYLVFVRVHDDLGNPYPGGDGFWVESYGEAIRHGREIRRRILAEKKAAGERVLAGQLTLDDALKETP